MGYLCIFPDYGVFYRKIIAEKRMKSRHRIPWFLDVSAIVPLYLIHINEKLINISLSIYFPVIFLIIREKAAQYYIPVYIIRGTIICPFRYFYPRYCRSIKGIIYCPFYISKAGDRYNKRNIILFLLNKIIEEG